MVETVTIDEFRAREQIVSTLTEIHVEGFEMEAPRASAAIARAITAKSPRARLGPRLEAAP